METKDEKLSGRDLDAAVAERVMGELRPDYPDPEKPWSSRIGISKLGAWSHPRSGEGWQPFHYSSYIELAMKIEDRIAELGLQSEYIAHLWSVVGATRNGSNFWTADNFKAFWLCVHATPEQRCLAALAAVETKS